jgi:hypothetical protein
VAKVSSDHQEAFIYFLNKKEGLYIRGISYFIGGESRISREERPCPVERTPIQGIQFNNLNIRPGFGRNGFHLATF